MDYTKTDQQLRNIGEGLKEIDEENNFSIFLRGNAKNGEIYSQVIGKGKNLTKMISITMLKDERFRSLIFEALGEFSLMKLHYHEHTESDCKKCNDPDCKSRKADYEKDSES